ncbi:MAG: hypothetical protein JXA90_04775 [Planctomycetes bacterium]|nr:hypothetical protein [Planctomycetota bacterium]
MILLHSLAMMPPVSLALGAVLAFCCLPAGFLAEEREPLDLRKMFSDGIPVSLSIEAVYGYADAMLRHGRDAVGPQRSGLFLSALDRETLSPLDRRPPPPAGVRPAWRPGPEGGPLVGANPQLDQNLLRLLYFLEGLSGEDRYPRAADEALRWFLLSAQSPRTGLYPWGRSSCWNALADEAVAAAEDAGAPPEMLGPWLLWQRCFALAPEECLRFAHALRLAWTDEPPRKGGSSAEARGGDPVRPRFAVDPRQAGFAIRAWAEAYARTRDGAFVDAIASLERRISKGRSDPAAALDARGEAARPSAWLSLAIDLDGAARRVPEPLRSRLARAAGREDALFTSLSHLLEDRKGFAAGEAGSAAEGASSTGCTPLWDPRDGGETTARVAMVCVSRYENTGDTRHRDLILAAADAYLEALPAEGWDVWPATFGHAISLELSAFRITAREPYYLRAVRLAEIAIERFFEGKPLPRASLLSEHYEATTGAASLVLAFVDLHLTTRQITAVRAPPNTIDR